METPLKLMCVLAHPDDETLGMGGTLARYAAEGVEITLVTATRGERGWFGPEEDNPGLRALGRIREGELRRAARILGIHEVTFLDYIDGELDQADPDEVIGKIAAEIRRVRPDVVVTFDPYGIYGHPDHIAICQFTTAATLRAANPAHADDCPAHSVSKLYYCADTEAQLAFYQQAFGDLVMLVDGVERRGVSWPMWAVTTHIDTAAHWDQIWDAIVCHRSQLPGYEALIRQPEIARQAIGPVDFFYRAYSLVNGGRAVETDLFEGIRENRPLNGSSAGRRRHR